MARTLHIVHFNDVYNIEPSGSSPGAARFTTLVKSFAALKPLVLFAGDAFSPSLMSTVTRGSQMVGSRRTGPRAALGVRMQLPTLPGQLLQGRRAGAGSAATPQHPPFGVAGCCRCQSSTSSVCRWLASGECVRGGGGGRGASKQPGPHTTQLRPVHSAAACQRHTRMSLRAPAPVCQQQTCMSVHSPAATMI